jgi:hypothetical protein
MFNLETAVDEWCQNIGNPHGTSAELKEELKDHLYCSIEELMKEDFTDKQAFSMATKELGQPDALLDEYSKNQKVFSRMCNSTETSLGDYSQQRSHVMSYKQNSKRLIGQSLLWAAVYPVRAYGTN